MADISPALARQIAQTIATEIGAASAQVSAAVALLDEGATVPFIARYRKEVTGGLDDTQLRNLETRLGYLRELEERRAAILASIDEQGKLSDELRAEIVAADTKRGWKTCTCRTSPSAAPARRSPARPGWNRWPMACCRPGACRKISPPPSSMPTRAWPTPRPRWTARARS
jgi:hypothetical protein